MSFGIAAYRNSEFYTNGAANFSIEVLDCYPGLHICQYLITSVFDSQLLIDVGTSSYNFVI